MSLNIKQSNYNIFVPHKEEIIIFNTFSGALGKFDKDFYERYKNNCLNQSEIEILTKKGILIPANFDERKKLYLDRIDGIKKSNFKNFRIWTTSGCNANCYYCFEKGIHPTTMTLQTAQNTINFIEGKLNDNDFLRLEWFGGEPLLNTRIIDYVSSKIKKICTEKKCTLESLLITNGSLITQEVAIKIKNEWGIGLVQITLDGFGECYNKAKNYNDPIKYNFNRVIESIKLLLDTGVKVTIRMNYDTTNYESLTNLINFLHIKFLTYNNISYYVYPIWSSENFISKTEADGNFIRLVELLVENNMGAIRKIVRLNYKKNACQSWNENTFTILPDGKISKCCETFNKIIGDIHNGIKDKQAFEFWTNPELEEKCNNCIYLPICQGGCKAAYFNKMPQCFALKPILAEFLKWYVDYMDAKVSIHN